MSATHVVFLVGTWTCLEMSKLAIGSLPTLVVAVAILTGWSILEQRP